MALCHDLEHRGGTRYATSVSPEADVVPSRGFEHHGRVVIGVWNRLLFCISPLRVDREMRAPLSSRGCLETVPR